MAVHEQIAEYIANQPEPKRDEMQALHRLILRVSPECRLWFLDGTDGSGKIVSNPNIGYGHRVINYTDGKTRDFYRVGLSANTTGLSIYIMGLEDKKYLSNVFGSRLGKASVTGYCVIFKSLKNIDADVLEDMIRVGFEA